MSKTLKRKQNNVTVSFVGYSSEDVTGSAHLIKYKNKDILLDFGFYQCNDKLKCYQINNRNLRKIKPKNLNAILISHSLHLDHYGNLPVLFKKGCTANVYVQPNTKKFFKILFEDNLKIVQRDAEYLSKREEKPFKELYTQNDIDNMMEHIVEVDFNKKIEINEFMSFRFTHNYHILNSSQIELFIDDKNLHKTIYYSGDIGNISIKNKPFVQSLQEVKNADIGIVENTYSMCKQKCNEETRIKDREKLETVIRETCLEKKKGNVIIGSFATQRTQEILVELFQLYGDKEDFNVPIVIDSPLAVKITKLFAEEGVLIEEDRQLINKILKWKNLKLISDWEDSLVCQNNAESKIVIACSGFGNAGRIREYWKKDISNSDSTLVFIGYSSPDSLSGIIKNGDNKYIKIDDVKCKNKCKVCNLHSFSSHIQHNDMLKLYSDMNLKEIYLVHSEMSKRLEFAPLLEEEYRKKNKTTKVFIGSRNLEIEV